MSTMSKKCGLACLLLSLALARPLAAQFVLGRVTDKGNGQALEGAFMQLLGPGGKSIAAVLSDSTGFYSLRALSPGEYRLRVQRIGYATRTVGPFQVRAGASSTQNVELVTQAFNLPTLSVEAKSRCVVRPHEGEAVYALWKRARRALAVAAWTAREAGLRFRSTTYTRRLGPDGKVVRSQNVHSSWDVGRPPFSSLPTDSLLANGFIQPRGGGRWAFYGPDPDVILSSGFLDTHCFHFERTQKSSAPVIGLSFEPSGKGFRRDVRGTLWLNRVTGALDSLSFEFTTLPWDVSTPATGSMALQRLWTGAWIIRDWHIRTPIVSPSPLSGLTGPSLAYAVTGIREDGGRVNAVYDSDGHRIQLTRSAVLAGVIRDTTTGRPLVGALVSFIGLSDTTRTNTAGAYRFASVLPGTYMVTFSQPALDSAGWRAPARVARLVAGRTDTLDFAAPNAGNLRVASGVVSMASVAGRVVDAETGRPVDGATVRISGVAAAQVTDAKGGFAFSRVTPGVHRVSVEQIAYGTTTDTLRLQPGTAVSVRFKVRQGAISLKPLVVTGRASAIATSIGGFYQRQRAGLGGVFLGPSYIRKHRGAELINLLSSAPGVTLGSGGGGTGHEGFISLTRQRRIGGKACFPLLFVDGHRLRYQVNSAQSSKPSPFGNPNNMNLVPPGDIAAIEVYEGGGFIPAQFMDEGASCGVVVVWTKRGEDLNSDSAGP